MKEETPQTEQLRQSTLTNPGLRPSSGFTLIELLAVLAVTAILVALLFPLANSIRDSSVSAKCIANLRQCGIAMLTAAGENNNQLTLVGGTAGSTTWLGEIEKVLGVDEALRLATVCPSHRPNKFDGNLARTYGVPMNPTRPNFLTTVPGGGSNTRLLYLSRLEKPADYPLLVDSSLNGGTVQWRTAWDNGNTSTAQARHKGRINVVLADGSAASMEPADYAAMRGRNSDNPSMTLIYQDEKGQRQEVSASPSPSD